MYRREDIRTWPDAKKEWVRAKAKKLTTAGVVPNIKELGLAYDNER